MKLKNTLLISTYVLLAALFFSGAYVMGNTIFKPKRPTPDMTENAEAVEVVSENTAYEPEYEVIYEDGKIIIYKCVGNIRTVVTSENVSETIFPKEDIDTLKKGVKFERLENAQQMFENFVS